MMDFMLRHSSTFASLPGLSGNPPSSSLVQAGESTSHLYNSKAAKESNESQAHPSLCASHSQLVSDIPSTISHDDLIVHSLQARAGSHTSSVAGPQNHQTNWTDDEELEEGELDDSQDEDAMVQPNMKADIEGAVPRRHFDHVEENLPSSGITTVAIHMADLVKQRRMAKAFLKTSGLSFNQLAGEGFDPNMLQKLFQEFGTRTKKQSIIASGTAGMTQDPSDSDVKSNHVSDGPAGPVSRENYLARLKALQIRSSSAKEGDSHIRVAESANPGDALSGASPSASQVRNSDPESASAQPVLLVQRVSNQAAVQKMFASVDRGLIRRVEQHGKDFLVQFSSAQEAQKALSRVAHNFKKDKMGKPFISTIKSKSLQGRPFTNGAPDANDTTTSGLTAHETYLSSPSVDRESAAISVRKERLARLREEALKSAKAAQLRKELAATRAGNFLEENFGTPTPSSDLSIVRPVSQKRSFESQETSTGPSPLKRPFGQPRSGQGLDDCIIEASDDEPESDAEAPSHTTESIAGVAPKVSAIIQQPNDSLKIQEQRITQMRQKIRALEQKSRFKTTTESLALLPDEKSVPVAPPARLLSESTPGSTVIRANAVPVISKENVADSVSPTLPAAQSFSNTIDDNVTHNANRATGLYNHIQELERDMELEESGQQDEQGPKGFDTHIDSASNVFFARSEAKAGDFDSSYVQDILLHDEGTVPNPRSEQASQPIGNDHNDPPVEYSRIGDSTQDYMHGSESSMSISEDESTAHERLEDQEQASTMMNDMTPDSEGLYEPSEFTAMHPAWQHIDNHGEGSVGFTFNAENAASNTSTSQQAKNRVCSERDLEGEAYDAVIPAEPTQLANTTANNSERRTLSKHSSETHNSNQVDDSIYGDLDSEAQVEAHSDDGRRGNASDYSLSPISGDEAPSPDKQSDRILDLTPGQTSSFGRRAIELSFNVAKESTTPSDEVQSEFEPEDDYEPAEIAGDVHAHSAARDLSDASTLWSHSYVPTFANHLQAGEDLTASLKQTPNDRISQDVEEQESPLPYSGPSHISHLAVTQAREDEKLADFDVGNIVL